MVTEGGFEGEEKTADFMRAYAAFIFAVLHVLLRSSAAPHRKILRQMQANKNDSGM
jgi:hypothetical protein